MGVSFIASGTAGLVGFAVGGWSGGHFDRANAVRSGRLASGIVGIGMFIYSFFDWSFENILGEGVGNQQIIDKVSEHVDTSEYVLQNGEFGFRDILNFTKYSRFFNVEWWQGATNEFIIEMYEKTDLALLPGQKAFPWNWDWLGHVNPNLTQMSGIQALNFPGHTAWILTSFLDGGDVEFYNMDIMRNNRASLVDNPSYYYDQMVRKGLYYTPYIFDFINGQGVFAQ